MSSLDLEKLGIVDLSTDTELLTQTIGGARPSAVIVSPGSPITFGRTPSSSVILGSVEQVSQSGAAVLRNQYGRVITTLRRQADGSYLGNSRTLIYQAPLLLFDDADVVLRIRRGVFARGIPVEEF